MNIVTLMLLGAGGYFLWNYTNVFSQLKGSLSSGFSDVSHGGVKERAPWLTGGTITRYYDGWVEIRDSNGVIIQAFQT